VVGVVQDAVSSRLVRLGRFVGDCAAGVAVAAKAGPVAAGDFEADPVAGLEEVGGRPQVNGDLVYLTGGDQLGLLFGVAVADPLDAVGEVDRAAVGEDVDEFAGEVGVGCGGDEEEPQPDWPGTSTGSVSAGVLYTRTSSRSSTARWSRGADAIRVGDQDLTADGRYRLVWVVHEGVGRLALGRSGRQGAVAAPGVGTAVAVQEIVGVGRVRQWPVWLGPPDVGTHDEDQHWVLVLDPVLGCL